MMLPPIPRRLPNGWPSVSIYLAIALAAVAFLLVLLKKTSPSHLTIGAVLTMLLYLTVGAFLILATRVFVIHQEGAE
ncbi:MAG TPA: hypothetical protein VNL35_22500 [Chloroflexota bacterium]|nr:hypothetical protein [Chloroflexota bacterium]